MSNFERQQVALLTTRLSEPRRFIQVVAGPRQVGKTTLVRQALARCPLPSVYASADGPSPPGPSWIEEQWDRAALASREQPAVLVLDEVHKGPGWSEVGKP
jgi:predicted AAA+ superfamily ATPase